ncbi:MAG TPA: hypothetical protein DEA22_12765 [Blastocatellia bacterium]|nr:hypothetical protein [Blastocatellia bacterium]
MLDRERKLFEKKKSELTAKHLGKFVLIKGDKLIGLFNTVEEALSEGARQFGLVPFLVRQVSMEGEGDISIPALSLGLLRANSTRPL